MSTKWFATQVLFIGLLSYLCFVPAPFGIERKVHFKAPCYLHWYKSYTYHLLENGWFHCASNHDKDVIYYGWWEVQETTLILHGRMAAGKYGPESKPFIIKVELTKDLKQCKGTHVRIVRD